MFHNISACSATIGLTVKNNDYVCHGLTEFSMNKPLLLDIVCAITLFAMSGSIKAASIVSDNVAIAGFDQPGAQTIAVSPASLSDAVVTLDNPLGAGTTLSAGKFNYPADGDSTDGAHRYSSISLWLLLVVAAVFAVLSEILERRSSNR